ncbi:non-homologous end-joining factor 1 [Synchiropus splendidus]|uniref:non-homologous end-joining factor 1 n=1 Tax=Synchiropus splendidus TaxID=270530 RepID=UPI00237E7F18|nr:non-homologous end-joining factor 1 [Synchiropus splendidus]
MSSPSNSGAHVLLQHPWLPITIDGISFLAKINFGSTEYQVLLTDLQSVWQEKMDITAIQTRAAELNKRLRAPVEAFFSHLCKVVRPIFAGVASGSESAMKVERQDSGDVVMKLKSKLAGLPFHWEFQCAPAPVTVVCSHLVNPLLAMCGLLQEQVDQLSALLTKKDAEILDYKENGATLSRERLQTTVFEKKSYRDDFMTKVLPLACSRQNSSLDFSSDLQQLYTAVVAPENGRKRKLSEQTELVEIYQSNAQVGDVRQEQEPASDHLDQTSETQVGMETSVEQPATQPVTVARVSSKPKKKKGGLFK